MLFCNERCLEFSFKTKFATQCNTIALFCKFELHSGILFSIRDSALRLALTLTFLLCLQCFAFSSHSSSWMLQALLLDEIVLPTLRNYTSCLLAAYPTSVNMSAQSCRGKLILIQYLLPAVLQLHECKACSETTDENLHWA